MSKKTILILLGVVGVGSIGYYFYSKKKQGGITSSVPNQPITIDKPQLSWIESKEVSDWLQSKYSEKQLSDLRGWLDLIKKERAIDSTKWVKSDEFSTLQISDIAGALYQMKIWDGNTKLELQSLK